MGTEIQGTLTPDGTLILDERPNVPAGRVRVTVQPEHAVGLHMTPAEQAEASRLSKITRDPRWNNVGDEADLLKGVSDAK